MIDFKSSTPPSNDTITNALHDFGLYHRPQTAIRMYAEYKNNGRYWYPGAGVDQPDAYWSDISIMNWLSLFVEHVLPNAQQQNKISKEDVIERMKRGGSING